MGIIRPGVLLLKFKKKINKIATILHAFYYYLSEFETHFIRPGDKMYFRKKYLNSKKVKSGERFYIGRFFYLHNGYNISFGECCSFGEYAKLMDHGKITVGNNFIAATGLQINSGSHDPLTLEPYADEITVGENVWCGANVTIILGAKIGNNVVIGANSLVNSTIPDGSIAVGSPAKVINKIDRENITTWNLFNVK